MDGASKGFIFDWAIILSDNLATYILAFRSKCGVFENIILPFYMSAYIMDALCFSMELSSMGSKWNLQDPTPTHVYHDILWDSKYHQNFYLIFNGVRLPTYQVGFDTKAPHMSPEVESKLLQVGNWFGEESFTYIRVYGSLEHPHVLPLFILDKLMSRETTYQTIGNGISKVLKESNKKDVAFFTTQFGIFSLDNYKHAQIEIKVIQDIGFPTIPNGEYDTHHVVKISQLHQVFTSFLISQIIFMIYLEGLILIHWWHKK